MTKQYRLAIALSVATLVMVMLSLSGCIGSNTNANPNSPPEPMKPKPAIESVTAATSGIEGNYYAIVDVALKNEGADGTVIVVGNITQGAQTMNNQMPVYITHNSKQTVKLIFPLKWKGGDWTPSVKTEVP